MATCRDVVTRALRMAKVVPRSDEPDAEELRDGLIVLQSLYDTWLTNGMFGRLKDVYEEGDYEAGEGERVMSTGAITLPSVIDDDRKPRDLSAIETFTGSTRAAYIWDRTAWVSITNLAESATAPLSDRGMNGLAACLAQAYCEEFGEPLTSSIVMQAAAFRTGLSFKFGTTRDVVAGSYY